MKQGFDAGIGNLARRSWSGGRVTPNQEAPLPGFYTGIVMDDADDQRMGQVWVYIPTVSQERMRAAQALPVYGGTAPDRDTPNGEIQQWDQNLRNGWIQCYPLMPFFGGDDFRVGRSPGGDPRNAGNGDVNAYGMWAQPRIGDEVGILFASGDAAKGFWIGMVPKYARNYMVPGSPGRNTQDLDPKKNVPDEQNPNDSPAIHRTTKQLKDETASLPDAWIPALDKARRLSTNSSKPVETEFVDVLVSPDFAQNIQKAGLLCDHVRGAGNSSSRRESPSYVFGFKSAGWNFDSEKSNVNTASGERIQFKALGSDYNQVNSMGHQFTMDDHPDYQGMRLRTSAGSQLYFNDTCNEPYIYISTAQGNVWIEIIDNGKINIFAEDSVSIHARSDINLTADRDINIDAQRDLNVQVRRNTNFKFKGKNEWELGRNDLAPQNLDYNDSPDWGTNTSGGADTKDTFIQSFGNVDLTIGSTLQPERNLQFNVTQDVDGTIGRDMNLDIVRDLDVIIGQNMRLETIGNIDIKSGGNTHLEQQGTLDILTIGAGTWTASTHDHFSTDGDFTVTASPNIHLNGPQAATASAATDPNAVIPAVPPALPQPAATFRVPTDTEVRLCEDPPTEFLTWNNMTVPQHQPYPERCQLTAGSRGFVQASTSDVSRRGSSTASAFRPINLPEKTRFRQAQNFSTMNQGEAPSYDDVAPQGSFAPCSTYELSDKGLDFLHGQEGIRTKAYPDTDKYAIGYGHNIKVGDIINGDTINGRVTQKDIDMLNRTKGQLNISKEEARRLFREDSASFKEDVCAEVTTDITQGQFDALMSFTYNGGRGGLRRMVQRSDFNSGSFEKVPQAWMRLSTASGTRDPIKRSQQEAGLRRRRRRELEELFAQA